jgi:CubicO group peptidase (beta-lactamase class C family)
VRLRLPISLALSLVLLLSIDRAHGQRPAPSTLDAARDAAAGLPRLRSLLVAQNGQTLLEYFAKGTAGGRVTNVKSVSKSVISTLVGIAIERRLIPGVRQPIATYFPELARDADPRKRRITIEDLLTMRSGLTSTSFDNYGAWVSSRNWVDYVLRRPMIADPGEDMEYSTGNTHLLSAILTRATKQSTWAFAQQQLGTPLGFRISRWPRDPQGIYFGGNDMLLSPGQMLSIGQLYLDRGRARPSTFRQAQGRPEQGRRATGSGPSRAQPTDGSRQVVPASWVDAACTGLGRSRFNPDQTYGYGWWSRDFAGRQGCFAWGYGGQYIIVFRDLNLVVVTTSSTEIGDERRDHRRQIFDIIERLVLPALSR